MAHCETPTARDFFVPSLSPPPAPKKATVLRHFS